MVAGAGVATNLFLAVVFGFATRVLTGNGMEVAAGATAIIALVNLFLGLFNLIPIPPLDGYTVLRGLLPYKYALSFRTFEARLAQGGLLTLVGLLFLFSYVFAGIKAYFLKQYGLTLAVRPPHIKQAIGAKRQIFVYAQILLGQPTFRTFAAADIARKH
jgi:Zn-dependent protease